MNQLRLSTRLLYLDLAGSRWSCLYFYSRTILDARGREVIATVPVRSRGWHGTAISVSDSELAETIVFRNGHVAIF